MIEEVDNRHQEWWMKLADVFNAFHPTTLIKDVLGDI